MTVAFVVRQADLLSAINSVTRQCKMCFENHGDLPRVQRKNLPKTPLHLPMIVPDTRMIKSTINTMYNALNDARKRSHLLQGTDSLPNQNQLRRKTKTTKVSRK